VLPFRQRRHAGEFCDANDVLAENVTFQIDRISRLRKMQIRMLPRIRDDLNVKAVAVETCHGQADPVNGDGSLSNDVWRQDRRIANRQPEGLSVRSNFLDRSGGVDVALDEMAADPGVRAEGSFEIHQRSAAQCAERGHSRGLRRDVGMDRGDLAGNGGQAHAIHGDAVSR